MTSLTLLLTLFLACGDKDGGDGTTDDTGGGDGGADGVDADSDGYPVDQDCNDNNAAVFPGATEVCNGWDDDCDELVDDDDDSLDTSTQGTWYPDEDGDTFGDDDAVIMACEGPTGAVVVGGDCDDTTADIGPGAAEVCNGVDDDCDDRLDDEDDDVDLSTAGTWYVDADDDGFGEDGTGVVACSEPPLTSAVGGDCDDADSSRFPGASELCDGIDNDCNEKTSEDGVITVAGATYTTLTAALEAAGEADVVQLCSGTYTGPFTTTRKATIQGVSGASVTTLTAARGSAILTAGGDLHVSGVTFSRGAGTYTGGIDAFTAKTALSITVEDCVFDANSGAYGGAVLAYNGSTLTAIDTTFTSNRATTSGGAVYANNAIFQNVTMSGNQATYGGAFMVDAGEFTIDRDSVFTSNNAVTLADGTGGYGGAGLVNGGSVEAESGAEFSSNAAVFGGGMMVLSIEDETTGELTLGSVTGGTYTGNTASASGGGLLISGTYVSAKDVTVNSNTANWGGGMAVESSYSTVEGAEIYDNVAEAYGGGLLFAVAASDIVISDTLVDNNSAPLGGAAALEGGPDVSFEECSVTSNRSDEDGGGFYLSDATLTLDGGQVTSNVADLGDGGGAWLYLAELFSFDVDWGDSEKTENSPDDVFVAEDTGGAGTAFAYGAGETFACDTEGCE
ncbi:putative metal-binding motif-containing protein [Myxococcota bacterium]|nr:putative metal-binding motif-containing protein [Myxococcota bacterium]